jgi:hypothetical protein
MTARDYDGGCQCGAVRYRARGVDVDNAIACNCSRCGRLGLALSFVPADAFELMSGEDSLAEYQFNKHVIHHLFCKVCGVQSFSHGERSDGAKMAAINVRCLDGIDANALSPKKVDGRSR